MNFNLTLVAQVLTFGIFLWFTARFVWPPLMRAVDARQKQIADGLAAGERGQQELDVAQKKAVQILREAHADAADVIAQTTRRTTEMMDQAKNEARAEADRMLAAARAEVEQMVHRAREQLRAETSAAALAAAARILEREIDAKTHQKLLKDLTGQI